MILTVIYCVISVRSNGNIAFCDAYYSIFICDLIIGSDYLIVTHDIKVYVVFGFNNPVECGRAYIFEIVIFAQARIFNALSLIDQSSICMILAVIHRDIFIRSNGNLAFCDAYYSIFICDLIIGAYIHSVTHDIKGYIVFVFSHPIKNTCTYISEVMIFAQA